MSSGSHGASPQLPAGAPPGTADTGPGAPTEEAPPGTADTTWLPDDPQRREPAAAVEQIIVPLVEKAATDLQSTQDRSRLSKTDIINRAVSLYEFIDAELYGGAELIVRRDGHDNLLKLFLHPRP